MAAFLPNIGCIGAANGEDFGDFVSQAQSRLNARKVGLACAADFMGERLIGSLLLFGTAARQISRAAPDFNQSRSWNMLSRSRAITSFDAAREAGI
ncbi:MAG: hypothetical protein JO172_08335 [Hyphomicrobiales bacterium]|nr:hypothetical protein [Hyphomicrobiales bacterium]